MYNVRREEYRSDSENNINFRISPDPFKLNKSQKKELEDIGEVICNYMDSCIELYKTNSSVHELLDRGKPEEYKNAQNIKYLFLRPDLILTNSGFSVCEIETSPFGLGLAEVLNRAYGNEGYDTVVQENQLKNYIQSKVGNTGTIAYSDKVKAFKGQLEFMANQLFSGNGKIWTAKKIGTESISSKEIYRAFYLNEQFTDKNIAKLFNEKHIYIPTSTPQFEEKALLSFIWDSRFTQFFISKLGESEFKLLRKLIPKTWVLGEEQYVDEGLPQGKKSSIELANIGKSNRKFVLKQSGFISSSSWGEGVAFLHKMGGQKASEMIKSALEDKRHLYIIQEFTQGKVIPMEYLNSNGERVNSNARIRLTPYYAYVGREKGKLIAAKVTGCENTEYIHASTASINTAITMGRD